MNMFFGTAVCRVSNGAGLSFGVDVDAGSGIRTHAGYTSKFLKELPSVSN